MAELRELADLVRRAEEEIARAGTREELERLRTVHLGRKGRLSEALSSIGSLPPDQRKEAGAEMNALKKKLEQVLADRMSALEGTGARGRERTGASRAAPSKGAVPIH